MKTSESITKVSAAIVAAQAEMGSVTKDAKNPFFKSNYATLNAVRESCMPVLSKHGLGLLQPLVSKEGKQYVETLVLHSSGEYIMSEMEVTTKVNANAQEVGSAVSYARRYSLMSLLALSAEDDDGATASGTVSKSSPVKKEEAPAEANEATPPSKPSSKGGWGKPKAEPTPVAAGDLY